MAAAQHLRLLAALANDVANSAALRRALAGREAALASLATDRQKEVRSLADADAVWEFFVSRARSQLWLPTEIFGSF